MISFRRIRIPTYSVLKYRSMLPDHFLPTSWSKSSLQVESQSVLLRSFVPALNVEQFITSISDSVSQLNLTQIIRIKTLYNKRLYIFYFELYSNSDQVPTKRVSSQLRCREQRQCRCYCTLIQLRNYEQLIAMIILLIDERCIAVRI